MTETKFKTFYYTNELNISSWCICGTLVDGVDRDKKHRVHKLGNIARSLSFYHGVLSIKIWALSLSSLNYTRIKRYSSNKYYLINKTQPIDASNFKL